MGGPSYIAIEGVIGVGKSTLARILAERLGGSVRLEEVEENPFLPKFYEDMRGYAFQTQIFFLLSRYRQQIELKQADLFANRVVSDYLFAKDRIFAYTNLTDEELMLYEKLFEVLGRDVPSPDVVIYLQASTDVLMERIRKRGRKFEQNIPRDYIETLNRAYNHFFFHYEERPLIIVNTDSLRLPKSEPDIKRLIEILHTHNKGVIYYRGEV